MQQTHARKNCTDECHIVHRDTLRIHEETNPQRVKKVRDEILEMQKMYPLLVDRATHTILDGHHRYSAAKEIGLASIPCILMDYSSDDIKVDSWRENIVVTKEEVLRRAAQNDLYPYKTSKHTLTTIHKIIPIDIKKLMT